MTPALRMIQIPLSIFYDRDQFLITQIQVYGFEYSERMGSPTAPASQAWSVTATQVPDDPGCETVTITVTCVNPRRGKYELLRLLNARYLELINQKP
jgi:hypothetical protein